jgi:hypothetical protein
VEENDGQSQSLLDPQLLKASAINTTEIMVILFIVKEFVLQRKCKLAT